MQQIEERTRIVRLPGTRETSLRTRVHVLFATWLGELFDGMDASIYVLILFPAMSELLGTTKHAEIGWAGSLVLAIFMLGWAFGAVVFGMLADSIGRARTMVLTIVMYSIFTGLCGLSHTWQELAIYRFFVGCGIGGEISIGAVLLAEHWKGRERLHAVGALGTSFAVGYFIAAILNFTLGAIGWRYLFFAGVVPALLTLYVRSRVPESAHFLNSKAVQTKTQESSTLHRLLSIEHRSKVFVVVGLASTTIIGYWAVLSWIPAWIDQLAGASAVAQRSQAAMVMNAGGFLSSLFGGFIIQRCGRAGTFRLSFAGALLTCLIMFATVKAYGPALLGGVFFAGAFGSLPFVVLFTYVPELFPPSIRSTAFGFSVQLGRIFAAGASLVAGQIIAGFGGSYALAASCVSLVYLVGIFFTWMMPVTSGEVLAEGES